MTDVFLHTVAGHRALVVVPEIREDLPPEIREGLARRRLLALGRPCPCGAQPPRPPRSVRREIERRRRAGKPGPIFRVEVLHEQDCPATDASLEAAAARHGVRIARWLP